MYEGAKLRRKVYFYFNSATSELGIDIAMSVFFCIINKCQVYTKITVAFKTYRTFFSSALLLVACLCA
jgi:hypothetical protein